MKGEQLSCTPPKGPQIWIAFLKMLSFSGKWVGFPGPTLQGGTSAGIANVLTKASSLSFEAREFPAHCQRQKNPKQNSVKSAEAI